MCYCRFTAGEIGVILPGGIPAWATTNFLVWTTSSAILSVGIMRFWKDNDTEKATISSGGNSNDQAKNESSISIPSTAQHCDNGKGRAVEEPDLAAGTGTPLLSKCEIL